MDERLGSMDRRLGSMDMRPGSMDERLELTDQRLDITNERLGVVESTLLTLAPATYDAPVRQGDGRHASRLDGWRRHARGARSSRPCRRAASPARCRPFYRLPASCRLMPAAPRGAARSRGSSRAGRAGRSRGAAGLLGAHPLPRRACHIRGLARLVPAALPPVPGCRTAVAAAPPRPELPVDAGDRRHASAACAPVATGSTLPQAAIEHDPSSASCPVTLTGFHEEGRFTSSRRRTIRRHSGLKLQTLLMSDDRRRAAPLRRAHRIEVVWDHRHRVE